MGIKDALFHARFDLVPSKKPIGMTTFGTWTDRRTGLRFGFQNMRPEDRGKDRDHVFMAYLDGVRMRVVYADLLRVSFEEFEIGSIGVKYRVEPGSFLDNINRQRREYDSDLVRKLRRAEAANQSELVESLRAQLSPRGTDIGLDELLKTEALVDKIGGDAKVAGYCFDAIRACHVYRVPGLEMMDEAVRAGTALSEIDLERPDTITGYKAKRVDFELG